MKFDDLFYQYGQEDFAEFCSFISAVFHDHYILLDKSFLNWQYEVDSPSNLSIDLIKIDKKIMGYLGSIPTKLSICGKSYKSKCLANLMVHPKLRRLGLGAALVQNAEKSSEILYVSGYNLEVKKVYDQLRWSTNLFLQRYIYVLDSEKVGRLAETEILQSNRPQEGTLGDNKFQQITHLPHDYEKFWLETKAKYIITVDRTGDYLNWRYINHPILRYDLFAVTRNGALKALAVTRIESTSNAKFLRIIDLISKDEAESCLFENLVKYAKLKKVAMIDFFFSGTYHLASLVNCGFRDSSKDPHDLEIPILFNPISKKKRYINFAYKVVEEKLSTILALDWKDWYVTKGDGDQDRPNKH